MALTWPLLGKIDAHSKLRLWFIIGYENNLISYDGQLGGRAKILTRNVVPKAGRQLHEQLMLNGHSYWRKKLQSGYEIMAKDTIFPASGLFPPSASSDAFLFNNVELPFQQFSLELQTLIDEDLNKVVIGPGGNTFEPMSGNCVVLENDIDGKIKTNLQFPVLTQPKLDGIRMAGWLIDTPEGRKFRGESRHRGEFKFIDHIAHQATILLNEFLPPDSILDGELFSYNLPFKDIVSRARQAKTHHPDIISLEYHLFDVWLGCNPDANTGIRYGYLTQAVTNLNQKLTQMNQQIHIKLVPMHTADSHVSLKANHDYYVQNNAEGLMVRFAEGPKAKYCFTRCDNLLKYKMFYDEEATIIGAESASGTEVGKVVWKVRTDDGHEFMVRPRGRFDDRAQLLINAEHFIGKRLTYRFQERTEYGKPRFPVGIAIRDYE